MTLLVDVDHGVFIVSVMNLCMTVLTPDAQGQRDHMFGLGLTYLKQVMNIKLYVPLPIHVRAVKRLDCLYDVMTGY